VRNLHHAALHRAPLAANQKIMIWGCITSYGDCAFSFISGSVNADSYIAVPRETLLTLMERMSLYHYANAVFQQDNATPHRARATHHFLNTEHICTTTWPALSPDMNPIENVWGLMKDYIRKHLAPENLTQLRHAISIAWQHVVTPALCAKLYASMSQRMYKVIKRCGIR
jgi:transposase